MEKVTLYISEKQMEKLRKIKEKEGIPVSESIRRAIDLLLNSRK